MIQRELWLLNKFAEVLPSWPCPHCRRGHLIHRQRDGHDDISSQNDQRELEGGEEYGYDPTNDHGTFSMILVCSRPACANAVAVCGEMTVGFDYDRGHATYPTLYWPKYFYPSLRIFEPATGCTEIICKEVDAAFSVFWSDSSSCANHIRCAIELLLADIGILPTKADGKYQNLKARIDQLPTNLIQFKDTFHAIRWLGNEGSHPAGTLTKTDTLDGFELLSHLLEERFDPTSARIAKITATMRARDPNYKPPPQSTLTSICDSSPSPHFR